MSKTTPYGPVDSALFMLGRPGTGAAVSFEAAAAIDYSEQAIAKIKDTMGVTLTADERITLDAPTQDK